MLVVLLAACNILSGTYEYVGNYYFSETEYHMETITFKGNSFTIKYDEYGDDHEDTLTGKYKINEDIITLTIGGEETNYPFKKSGNSIWIADYEYIKK